VPDWKGIKNLSHKDLLYSYRTHLSRYSRVRNKFKKSELENDFLRRKIRQLTDRIKVLSHNKEHRTFVNIDKALKKLDNTKPIKVKGKFRLGV